MKLFGMRIRTLGMFGIGFLAGSRAGRGPWDKAQAGMEQLKGRVTGGEGSMSMNGADGRRAHTSPQMTEL
jgi:hypothetical protein